VIELCLARRRVFVKILSNSSRLGLHHRAQQVLQRAAANPQSVMSMAGIESGYADIKTLTIPTPSF
jgi:hypothetical protein